MSTENSGFSNIASPDQQTQLLMLKDLTRRMGVLHDAQVLQLKMWPLVLLTHVRKCEERVNIESKVCEFVILQTKGKVPADIDKRLETLVDWTKWMLGDEWLVRIKLRDKLLYRRGPELWTDKS